MAVLNMANLVNRRLLQFIYLCDKLIDHFTVVCTVIWLLNGSEAEGDLVLIQDLTAFVV